MVSNKEKKANLYLTILFANIVLLFLGIVLKIVNINQERVMQIKVKDLQETVLRLNSKYSEKSGVLNRYLANDYIGRKAEKLGLIYPQKQCEIVYLDKDFKNVKLKQDVAQKTKDLNIFVDKAFADEKESK